MTGKRPLTEAAGGVPPTPPATVDALYFRVSSDRQTTENQFEDLLQVAERDGSGRDWAAIRNLLAQAVYAEQVGTHTLYRVHPEVVEQLAAQCVYLEQGKSGKVGAKRRPLFERMKRDAAARKFGRLLAWKVSRLGRDMRETISTVYDLADLGVTVVPVKSQTGPINSSMGRLLWSIQAWFAEMENDERALAIKAGHARARAAGKPIGRPRAIFRRHRVIELRGQGLSLRQIASETGTSYGSVRRTLRQPTDAPAVSHNSPGEGP
jgi:putative DNA-invertase from lambdoid prophage Rac